MAPTRRSTKRSLSADEKGPSEETKSSKLNDLIRVLEGGRGDLNEKENEAITQLEALVGKNPLKSSLQGELETTAKAQLTRWFNIIFNRLSALEPFNLEKHQNEASFFGTIAKLCTIQISLLPEASIEVPKGLLECIRLLHDQAFSLGGDSLEIQQSICQACELWWLGNLPDKEVIVPHTLPLVIIFSLDEDAKKLDVKRVYSLRKMLAVLDFEHDSSVTLKHLLLRCFLSPIYLCTENGSKFLSELFWIQDDFLADIHATVKKQLSFAANGDSEEADESMIERYAQVYFRGWRDAAIEAPHMQGKIEQELIQDLMDAAVNVANQSLAMSVFHFLNRSFHDNKNAKGVDSMLLRLYNPILWRALSVANPTVRFRAARLLARAFPLQDPDATVAETDEVLQRQFSAIETLLKDQSPMVRVAAVQGASRMLSVYWELIPRKATVSLVSVLVGELLHDSSSASVRVAVLKGLEFISENPLSQNALKDVLPHVSPLIHDQSKVVRSAVVSLLLRIKSIRAIKFYEIVPTDHLLERLAMDDQLGSKLTMLLQESFYPQGIPGSEQLSRILSLFQDHPRAAARFLENLHKHLATGQVCKLAMLLGLWISDTVAKEEDLEDSQMQELFVSVLQGISVLWSSVSKTLVSSRHKSARKQMEQAFGFSKFVKPIMEARGIQSDRLTLPPLLEIVSNLPRNETFLKQIIADVASYESTISLESLHDSSPTRAIAEKELNRMARELGPALHCLCFWDATDSLLEIVQSSLQAVTSKEQTSKRKKGKKVSKAKSAKMEIMMEPFVAIWCFQFVLANNTAGSRDAILAKSSSSLSEIETCLDELKMNPFAFETLMKLSIHREAKTVEKSGHLILEDDFNAQGDEDRQRKIPDTFNSLLNWCNEVTLQDIQDEDTKKRKKTRSSQPSSYGRTASILAVGLSECVAIGAAAELDDANKTKCASILQNNNVAKTLIDRFSKRFGVSCA